MSDGEMLAVWIVVTVVASIVLAGLAGRDAAYCGWGLIGPIGIAVAAVHGAEDRVLERLRSRATQPLDGAASPTGVADGGSCPHCRTDLSGTTPDRFGEIRCPSCMTYMAVAKPSVLPSDKASPHDLVQHPCPNCRTPLIYPKREEGGRVPCAGCGINALFGPATPNE